VILNFINIQGKVPILFAI